MHDGSQEFAETVRGDYRSLEQVELVYAEGDTGVTFDVISGDFQIDAGAEIRHNASFRLVAEGVAPAALRDVLRAPGTTARYSRGIVLSDGAQSSPTFAGGEYGRRPVFKRTEKVITPGQAGAMARGLLQRVLGGSSQVILEINPNPLLTLGDMCEVRSERLGINDPFIVEAIAGAAGREEIGQPWRVTLRRGVIPETVEL